MAQEICVDQVVAVSNGKNVFVRRTDEGYLFVVESYGIPLAIDSQFNIPEFFPRIAQSVVHAFDREGIKIAPSAVESCLKGLN